MQKSWCTLATAADATLQCLIDVHVLRTGKWYQTDNSLDDVNKDDLGLFKRVLTINSASKIVLRGSGIVISTVLREKAIAIANEGHQGLVET